MSADGGVPGHVFLSYVHEDMDAVDALERVLGAAGVRVWRDKGALWPGQDWRSEIRRAITDGALVFIACFSSNSVRREKSYQYEELALAIEQLRQRRPDVSWLIPVRLDDCEIPDWDIGGGRTLSSIQRVDLFGGHDREGVARLVAAVLRILDGGPQTIGAGPAHPDRAADLQPGHAMPPSHDNAPMLGHQASSAARASEWFDAQIRKQALRPAATDRWRLTHSAVDVPALTQLGSQAFDHPAYMRSAEDTPSWVRVRAVVACDLLGEDPGWQELRGRFAGLLTQESIRGLIWQLTDIPEGASWRSRGTHRRSWLQADMAVAGETPVPAASATLFLPEEQALAGLPPGCAQLTLHIDLTPGRPSPTAGPLPLPPRYWRERFAQALALPGELAGWLDNQLHMGSSSSPAAQAGIMLQSRQPLTELIDVSGIPALPGPAMYNQFTGWAVAEANGRAVQQLASQMMLDLSERLLHLDGSPEQMSGLTDQ